MLLIQGFFCQKPVEYGIKFTPVEGAIVTAQDGFVSIMFAGIIHHKNSDPEEPLIGQIGDLYGQSELSDIVCEQEVLSFRKRYIRKDGKRSPREGILYTLKKDGGIYNTWVGTYTGPGLSGPVRCVVTEIPDDQFQKDLAFYAKHFDKYQPDAEH